MARNHVGMSNKEYQKKLLTEINSGRVGRYIRDEDRDVVTYLYRGGRFVVMANYDESGDEPELLGKTNVADRFTRAVENNTITIEDADDTPVEDDIDWDWVADN